MTTVERFEQRLLDRFGSPLVGGGDLRTLLGYRTSAAFRQAAHRQRLPVPTLFVAGRRGRFARIEDLARYFAGLEEQSVESRTKMRRKPVPNEGGS